MWIQRRPLRHLEPRKLSGSKDPVAKPQDYYAGSIDFARDDRACRAGGVCCISDFVMMRYQTFLLFGAPGSGKGTQGKTLGTIPRYYHCACGDVFRSIDTRTKVGKAFLEYSSKGQLVPDDITVELWREAIDSAVEAHKFKPDIDILVLDGIPRNVGQAKLMNDMIDVKKVFNLACPDRETLFYRLKKRALQENRLDDANEEVIQRRLDIYEKESRPVLSYYSKELITVVDAIQPPVKVLLDILESVNDGVYEPAAV